MIIRKVKYVRATAPVPVALENLYTETGCRNVDIDESDLIIFRLMGAKFEYSAVVFKD